MFATIRRDNINSDKMDELIARVSGVANIFKAMPRHVAYYLVRSDRGILTVVGVFIARASAGASRQVAARWVMENVADV